MIHTRLAAWALGTLLLGACTQTRTPDDIVLRTDSVLADCHGMFLVPKGCFQTWRLPENTLYGFIFKNEIQGFTYEEGYEYTLRVVLDPIANPPVDGASSRYRLVRVENKVARP